MAVDTVTTRVLHTSAAFWGRWPRELQQDGSPFTEGGGIDGGGQRRDFHFTTVQTECVLCVSPVPITMLTVVVMIPKGDITDLEMCLHLQMSW